MTIDAVTVTSQLADRLRSVGLHELYRPLSGIYDEMLATDGSIRRHWARFLDGLTDMSDDELARRWRLAERLLHENGLTYRGPPTRIGPGTWISCRS